MNYLKNHHLLASNDLHEVRELLSNTANTSYIDVVGKRCKIEAVVNTASFSTLNLTHVTYGAVQTLVNEHESTPDDFLFCMPTGGAARVQHQGQEFDVSPDVGLMRDLSVPIKSRQDQFSLFALPLATASLKQHARMLIGDVADSVEFRFDARLDLSTPGGLHMRDTVHYVANALDGPLCNLDNPIVLAGFKDILLTNILTLLPNTYADLLQQKPSSAAVPYYVKRARDFIHAHAHTSITLEKLARHAGCGYRTLQSAFNDAYGMAPMAYVKSVRLTYVYNDLLNAEDGATVFSVALKWGFTHMGRFAQSYAKRFGVLPSETLRSRK